MKKTIKGGNGKIKDKNNVITLEDIPGKGFDGMLEGALGEEKGDRLSKSLKISSSGFTRGIVFLDLDRMVSEELEEGVISK